MLTSSGILKYLMVLPLMKHSGIFQNLSPSYIHINKDTHHTHAIHTHKLKVQYMHTICTNTEKLCTWVSKHSDVRHYQKCTNSNEIFMYIWMKVWHAYDRIKLTLGKGSNKASQPWGKPFLTFIHCTIQSFLQYMMIYCQKFKLTFGKGSSKAKQPWRKLCQPSYTMHPASKLLPKMGKLLNSLFQALLWEHFTPSSNVFASLPSTLRIFSPFWRLNFHGYDELPRTKNADCPDQLELLF